MHRYLVILLQSAIRGWLQRCKFSSARSLQIREQLAAIAIQRLARGIADRAAIAFYRSSCHLTLNGNMGSLPVGSAVDLITRFQARVRGALTRAAVGQGLELEIRHAAAVAIQSHVRRVAAQQISFPSHRGVLQVAGDQKGTIPNKR